MYFDYHTHQTHQTHIMSAERQLRASLHEQPVGTLFPEEELVATHWITVDFFATCCLWLWRWWR